MKHINKVYFFSFLLILFLLVVAFSNIFSYHLITAGDYATVNKAYLVDAFGKAFFSWSDGYNLGQNNTAFMNYAPYTFLIGFLGKIVQFNGIVVERIVWWLPFFILAFSSHFFLRRLVPQIGKFGFLSSFIFLFNTYTLLLLGGGQISGVGLAFAIAPFVLVTFIELTKKNALKSSLLAGLIFAIQVMFDVRIAYVTMIAVLLYILLNSKEIFSKNILKKFVSIFVIPLGITGLLHAFWILPTLIYHQNPIQQLGDAFSSTKAVTFFSFAKFENSLALLHPNWPENIFGKVNFMKPEFLLLPILAFSGLLFGGKKRVVLYFALLGLLGAFLAKGANDPFGGIYLWMFEHVPGFVMFRDPSKWYILVVLSYIVLIPLSISQIYNWLSTKFEGKSKLFSLQNLFLIIVLGYLLFLIKPAFLGQLHGAFQARVVPNEYGRLNTFLSDQPQFFRTLWIPTFQRYGLHSSQHPAIYGEDFFQTTDPLGVIKKLQDPKTQKLLQDAGVKYVIVPFDSEGEIFLTDRKYDEKVYQSTIKQLDQNKLLKETKQFDKIIVYELPNPQERFRMQEKDIQLETKTLNPTHYQITTKSGEMRGTLIFSDRYDPNWTATVNGEKITSQKFENTFNSLHLTQPTYTIDVSYTPQGWVERGLFISIGALVVLLIGLVIIKT